MTTQVVVYKLALEQNGAPRRQVHHQLDDIPADDNNLLVLMPDEFYKDLLNTIETIGIHTLGDVLEALASSHFHRAELKTFTKARTFHIKRVERS